ncbi:hypothetical protein N5C96_29200 [Delftia tsuruhatensis]|uniref:hypothetical protein n=1 Tax=Delftia tsuruhatensis TaxID=180282 RepID=UPI00244D0AC6|nr:hypothetical protein [Delftia tsuruhatensis]MDH0777496.1 hypothetical protein [Delftia tsuruhatensis]MDH1824657.1 hypothetical protein [Delftia tsuruhatensis]
MKKEHPHAQVLRWIADGESVQFMWTGEGGNNEWYELLVELGEKVNKSLLSGSDDYKFRIKPKTITVGDREIEAPVMSGPGYYITDHGDAFRWFGEATLDPGANLQKLGRIYATEEAARAAQEAITALLTREPS